MAEIHRCDWSLGDPIYIDYHDKEWGIPVHDDQKLFEFLVLKKREGYRNAFAGFDPEKVARFTEKKVEKLLQDASIIRNNLKVRSAISNAKAFLKVQDEF